MAGQHPRRPALFLVVLFAVAGLAGCVTEAESPPTHFPSIQVDGVYTYKDQPYRVATDHHGVDRYLQNRTLVAFEPADTTDEGGLENGTWLYDAATRDRFRNDAPFAMAGRTTGGLDPFQPLMLLSGQPLMGAAETHETFLHDMKARLQVVDLRSAEVEDAWRVEAVFRLGDTWNEQDNRTFNVTFARVGAWYRTETTDGALDVVRTSLGTGPLPPPEAPPWPRVAADLEQDFAGLLDADEGRCSPPLTIRDLAEHPLITSDLMDWLDAHPTAAVASYGYTRGGTPLGRYNDRPDRHSVSVTFATEGGEAFMMTGAQYTGKPGEPMMPIEDLDWGPTADVSGPGAMKVVPIGDLYCIDRAWYGHQGLPTFFRWFLTTSYGARAYIETDPPASVGQDPTLPHQLIELNGCTGALLRKTVDETRVFSDDLHEPCWQRIDK